MSTFKLRVISAEGKFFEGECESLVFPTLDGKTGILADHCNMLGAVSQGIAEFTTPDGTRHCAAVDEGFVKVEDNDVLLLAEDPEKSEANRARREAQRLKEEELLRRSIREYKEAQATVAKTVNTLRGVDKVERIQ